MYLHKKQAEELIKHSLTSTTEEVKEKTKFMLSLLHTDDWSMIIKSHALIEMIVTELIIAQTEEAKLKPFIERLPLSDNQTGKLKIVKDYNLLTNEQCAFIKKLSELRNLIVHKFENVNFNLKNHVDSFDTNQKKSWGKAITWHTDDQKTKKEWEQISITQPSLGLWFSTYMFISLTIVTTKELESLTKINKQANATTKELLKELLMDTEGE